MQFSFTVISFDLQMLEVLWLAVWKTMWSTPKSVNDLKIARGLFDKLDILGYHPFIIPDSICPDRSTYSYNDGIPSNWGMKIFSVPTLTEPAVNQTNNRTADNTLFMGTASNLFVNMVGFLLASFNAAIKFTLAIKLASSANKTCTAHVITPCKGTQDRFGFYISSRGFWIPGTGFQCLSVELGSV